MVGWTAQKRCPSRLKSAKLKQSGSFLFLWEKRSCSCQLFQPEVARCGRAIPGTVHRESWVGGFVHKSCLKTGVFHYLYSFLKDLESMDEICLDGVRDSDHAHAVDVILQCTSAGACCSPTGRHDDSGSWMRMGLHGCMWECSPLAVSSSGNLQNVTERRRGRLLWQISIARYLKFYCSCSCE